MNDTHPEVTQRIKQAMRKRSNAERLRMGCSMYNTAKTLVVSSIKANHPNFTPERLKFEIFLRFYGGEFNSTQHEKIKKHFAPPRH